jgi:hypothetical protein
VSATPISPNRTVSYEEVRDDLAEDWFRTAKMLGKGALCDALGEKRPDKVDDAITGKHVPRLHTALNSLRADPSAMLNTFLRFGGCFVPVTAASTGDMATISAMLRAATEYLDRMKDGQRCPRDTAALAELFRPLIPAMLAIIKEAGGQPIERMKPRAVEA